MTTLYKRHQTGQIGTWTITNDGGVITMATQTGPGNKITKRREVVTEGKAGRTLKEQVESRMNSRINTKLDRGYKHTETEATTNNNPTGQTGLLLPMLAQRKLTHIDNYRNVYVQPKLDGMRLVIGRLNGEMIAYTRRGKTLPPGTVDHILADIAPHCDEGELYDGELYRHGTPLQTIMSWAKRAQADSGKLHFYAFDYISNAPFSQRLQFVNWIGQQAANIVAVPTNKVEHFTGTVKDLTLRTMRGMGYEGLIVRDGDATYQPGARPKSLIKVKEYFDEEYPIVDITTGAMGVPVLICMAANGKTFHATAPGDATTKQQILANAELHIGNLATIKHVGLTPYGIPFHPVCTEIRNG